MCENRKLKEKCDNMKNDYSVKLKEEIRKVENKYEDENSYIGYVTSFQFLLKKNLLEILNLKMIFILIQKNRLKMKNMKKIGILNYRNLPPLVANFYNILSF